MKSRLEQREVTTIPVVQIRPNCLLVYNQIINRSGFKSKHVVNPTISSEQTGKQGSKSLTGEKTYSGDMTKASVMRLKRVVNTLVAISEEKVAEDWKRGKSFRFKLNFITLTLPAEQGMHTDKDLKKKALDPLLKRLKRKYNLKSYVWKAEKQKNGNLHFHLTTDTYIHYEDLRNEWNGVLTALGYIETFRQKHGHSNPNSTDIHAIHKVRDLTSYLVKYMTKANKDDGNIDGKMWDCSINLKQKIKCALEIDNGTHEWLVDSFSRFQDNIREKEWCTFLFLKENEFKKVVNGKYLALYNEWRKAIREYERPERMIKVPVVKEEKRHVKRFNKVFDQLSLVLPPGWTKRN